MNKNLFKFLTFQKTTRSSLFSTTSTLAKPVATKPLSELLTIEKPSDYALYKQPGSLHDPPYINKEKPFPNYKFLNINFISYDYIKLEGFYKHVDNLCKFLKIKVKEAYSMPARTLTIKAYKPYSTTLDKEYKIYKYHRVVRVEGLTSTLAPILYECIQLNLPEGVQLNVTEPTSEEDEFRYIPDIEMMELKKSLDEATVDIKKK
jgi:hypothetical protein